MMQRTPRLPSSAPAGDTRAQLQRGLLARLNTHFSSWPTRLIRFVGNMQSLLHWTTDLDPRVVDTIRQGGLRRGGPSCPVSTVGIRHRLYSEPMKEALEKAQDTSLDEDSRIMALDNVEMVRLHDLRSNLIIMRYTHVQRKPSSSGTLTMQMVRLCVLCARACCFASTGDSYRSRSREAGHVGAASGLAWRTLRQSEGEGAVGYWHGFAEQPLGAESST